MVWSPWKYCSSGRPHTALYRNALNAPGSTLTYPNEDSSGLSRMLLILYSKFCAATSGLNSLAPCLIMAWISPQAPPSRLLL